MSSYVVCKTNLSGRQHALECATFAGSELHSFVLGATVIGFSYWYGGESSRERKFLGAKVPYNFRESESSLERKFHGVTVPPMVYFRSWERKYVGTKVP